STAAYDDYFVGYTIKITGGTGVGQTAVVTDYNYATKTFTVSPAFTTAPGSGSVYSLTPNVLTTGYTYDDAGMTSTVMDPKGVFGKNFYDRAGRLTKSVEAYVDGSPDSAGDRATEYTY